MIRPEQIRAARALLGWSQAQLAAEAGLSKTGLANIENGADPRSSTLNRIEQALEKAGVHFTEHGVELPPASAGAA